MRIAVDAMGGDRAPGAVIEGALLAQKELGIEVLLVGQKDVVETELARRSSSPTCLPIIPASQAVAMDESPSAALKKKDSSMKVAFELLKRGEVQAFVSAGNSGAMMATGMFVLGNLPHVERPAILVVVPTLTHAAVIIDAGATVDCKPRHLLQFALMGSIYAESVLGTPRPRVGVLSNGEEEGKGNDLTRAASEQIAATALNFIGYVEGRDICGGNIDVVVCDGFTGNVTLKTMEGVAHFTVAVLKDAFQKNTLSRLGYLLSRKALREAFARLDHTEYGGALLLGLDGVAIIAHGGSSPKEIKNAIRVAGEAVSHDVNRRITEVLEELSHQAGDKFPGKIWRRIRSKIETAGEKNAVEEEERKGKGDEKD
ncbi:MAG: phosphate acyltransferase PlsX [Deltaproteobacteria bacterium]|nr:phosphate acyltransferase PlsX [Deltaproteobacteria bacterium]